MVDPIDSQDKPHVVSVNLAEHTLRHLQMLLEHGAITGQIGNRDINPRLRSLVDGIYNVLAGGDVEVNIKKEGNAGTVEEFKDKECMCVRAFNELNTRHKYGTHLVMEV